MDFLKDRRVIMGLGALVAIVLGTLIAPEPKPAPRQAIARERIGSPRLRMMALAAIGDDAEVDIHFQPFELNAAMPPEGQDIGEHLQQKYGATPEQSQRNREAIAALHLVDRHCPRPATGQPAPPACRQEAHGGAPER